MFRPITVNGRLLDLPADYATRGGLLGKVPVAIVNVYNAVLSIADNVLEDFFRSLDNVASCRDKLGQN